MATQKDVACCLETLPETLTKAYDEIYKRICAQKGTFPRLALNAFRWLQCSYEPLRTETLLDAITAEIDDSGTFSHYTIQPNDLLKACQNLLIMDEALNVFRFAHLSVDEYMQRKLCRIDSQAEIAKVCLSLLCSPAWDGYDTALSTFQGRNSNRHLLLYSAVFWPWHFAHCDDSKDCPVLTGLWNTFVSEETHRRWLDYHRQCVLTDWPVRDTFFWQRSATRNKEGYKDVLSTVCIYGLGRKFETALEAMSLMAGPLSRSPSLGPYRTHQLLLHACKFGDLDIARRLCEDDGRPYVSPTNWFWETPLCLASEGGHEALVRLVIDRGADVSASDEAGQAPLHLALQEGHEATAQLLISRGADLTAASKRGHTPLHLAALKGYEAIAQLLIDRGADPTAADIRGRTPLHFAVQEGHEATAQLLIRRGADFTAIACEGLTPLHLAALKGYEAIARQLIDLGTDVSASNEEGQAPLHLALQEGHEATAQLLISRGAVLTAANKRGQTPLHLAALKGYEAIAQLLISQGVDLTAADKKGQTPLHLAAFKGYEVIARQLIDLGTDVSASDEEGQAPLHIALQGGHEATAQLLIGRGADLTATDREGLTPLHLAALKGYEALARLLIERGADLSAADSAGRPPLHLASKGGHRALIRLLRDHGAPWVISTVTGAPWRAPSSVRDGIDIGGDIDT